jgi:hypothetical protein
MYDTNALYILNMAVRSERQRLQELIDGTSRAQHLPVRRHTLRRFVHALGVQLESIGTKLQARNSATGSNVERMRLGAR